MQRQGNSPSLHSDSHSVSCTRDWLALNNKFISAMKHFRTFETLPCRLTPIHSTSRTHCKTLKHLSKNLIYSAVFYIDRLHVTIPTPANPIQSIQGIFKRLKYTCVCSIAFFACDSYCGKQFITDRCPIFLSKFIRFLNYKNQTRLLRMDHPEVVLN